MWSAVIRDRWQRRVLLITAVLLLGLTAAVCSVRIAWIWNTAAGPGLWAQHRIMIEHGRLIFETQQGSVPPSSDTAITNWQFDPGLDTTTYHYELQGSPPGVVSPAQMTRRTYGVAIGMLLVACVCIVLLLPIRRVPRGKCVCGYRLDGVGAGGCPECGRGASEPCKPL